MLTMPVSVSQKAPHAMVLAAVANSREKATKTGKPKSTRRPLVDITNLPVEQLADLVIKRQILPDR